MGLSKEARYALGDRSNFITKGLSQDNNSSVSRQLDNARTRLYSVGVNPEENKGQDKNFLLKTLDLISRPRNAADNMIREFTNTYAGSTPGDFDPLGAFWRGLKGDEKTQGKDIMEDIGLNGDTGIFGGEAKWYNPSAAGAAGLALDIFNPLDATNWVGFGVGDDIVKGASKGLNALNDAFGATRAAQIADLLNSTKKVADVVEGVTDTAKAVDKVSDTAKAVSAVDDLGAENVGKLIRQVMSKTNDTDVADQVSKLMQEGLMENGLKATSKLDYKAMKPLQIGLQNPLTIGNSGISMKLPGYKATDGAAKLPILFPGKNIEGTFKNIPGSEYVTYAVSLVTDKIKNTKVGQTLGRAFSTAFVPNTVPNSVVKKSMTSSDLRDLTDLARTSPDNVPLTLDELKSLDESLSGISVGTTFDTAEGFSATDLKKINKGQYVSLEGIAKKTGIKGLTTDEMSKLIGSDNAFGKSITELYDELRVLKPTGSEKELFVEAAKLRKTMDLMYEQIPEGLKPYFSGVVKAQNTDLYPSTITTHRLGKNVVNSPLMAYTFDYKGVPVSVVVNSGENFNVDAWNRVGSTLDALDELPDTAIQALKGQIDISPVPIKNPDTSMTIGDTIVLGRIDKDTVAHEYGHIWDKVSGNQGAYSKAILSDSSKNDDVITLDNLYSDYARSLYDTDNALGIKEDLADSVSDYLKDRKTFKENYPARAAEIERMLSDSSISKDELTKLIADQRGRAQKMAELPRTERQIKTMMDSVDTYAKKLAWEPGTKTYQAFRENMARLFEETNWKTKQWQEQVGALFEGVSEEERKQIMDAAAQIVGTEIPRVKVADDITEGWSERQINALDEFLKWRNSVVKQYRQIGIPINELEKYVPFIPMRTLKAEEADTLKTMFGTGVKSAEMDNFDTLMAELTKQDPNLKARTTNATRPGEVNSMLKKPWLTEDAAVAMSIRGTRAIKAQEFSNFADEFVKTYGLGLDELGQIANGTIPEGYGAFKVGKDTQGNKVFQAINSIPKSTEAGVDTVFLPNEMVNLYNEYSKAMFNPGTQNGFLQLYDRVNSLYKKTAYLWNPGHVFRDFQGNVFNNYLMGVVDPTEYMEGLKVARGADGVLKTPNGDIPYSEVLDKARKMGIIDSQMEHELPNVAGKTEGKYTALMRKSTQATDGWTRTTGFVHNLKQGMNWNEAAATTKKFLFDYMDLTSFERKVMRRVVPFYTWMRKNIPLQLEVMLKNPRLYSRINSIQNSIAGEDIDWGDKPEYIQDSMAVQPINSNMYASMSLPYQDIAKIPTSMDDISGLLSSVSPIIRAPVESAINRKFWTGQDLEEYSGEQTDIPVLTTLMELLTGQKGPQVDSRVTGNLLSNVPLLTRAGNMLDTVSGKETNDARNLSRLSTSVGGPSLYDASSVETSGLWDDRNRLIALIQLLQDQGVEVPTMAEINEVMKKSGNGPKKSDMKGYKKVPHRS